VRKQRKRSRKELKRKGKDEENDCTDPSLYESEVEWL